MPWRDLPAAGGPWDAVYHRFRRWEAHGIWRKLGERLQTEDGHDALHLLIDAICLEEMGMHLRHATVHGYGYSRDCYAQSVSNKCLIPRLGALWSRLGVETHCMHRWPLPVASGQQPLLKYALRGEAYTYV